MTPIEFATGQVAASRSTWLANDNTPASSRPRQLVPIVMPDIPTNLAGGNQVAYRRVMTSHVLRP